MKNVLIILVLGIFFNAGNAQHLPKGTKENGYKIGSKAEDFNLKNVDGQMYSLASIKDAKGYVVIFTGNVCPFAVAYEDRMIDLHKEMASRGYPIIAINSNDGSSDSGDSFQDMIAKKEEKNFPFLYLKDDKEVYKKFGADKTPHVYLLDQDMVVRYIGAIDDSPRAPEDVKEKFLKNAILALQNGENPAPETTKAIGCPIKAKGGKKGGRRGPPDPNQIMESMDANKDQKITKDEAKGPLSGDFDRLDENKDGVLTMDELSKLKKRK